MTMEYKEFAPLPTGDYPARIKGWETAEGNFGPQYKWELDLGEVEDADGNTEQRSLMYYTPQTITARNKLGKLVQAAGFELGEDMDEDSLLNKRVIASVVRKRSDDGASYFNRIEELSRPKVKGNSAAKPAEPAQAAMPAYVNDDLETIPF